MHDFRYALRLIRQNWAFSLTVILILALCIGANTAVLSVVNAAMIRPLPYPEPGRLYQPLSIYQDEAYPSVNGLVWQITRDHVPALEIGLYGGSFSAGVNMTVNHTGILVQQGRVSAGFFHVLGIAPEIGREFNPDEDREGGPKAAILSYHAWQKYLHGDRNAIGSSIDLRGEPYTIVGIMPRGFRWNADADLWTPVRPSTHGEGGGTNYHMIARLRPGATFEQADTQMANLTPDLQKSRTYDNDFKRIGLASLQEGVTTDLRAPLKILWIAVAAVFLLGCVNIGGMQLARASGRIGEIATRLALGAPLARIIRQLLIESVVLR